MLCEKVSSLRKATVSPTLMFSVLLPNALSFCATVCSVAKAHELAASNAARASQRIGFMNLLLCAALASAVLSVDRTHERRHVLDLLVGELLGPRWHAPGAPHRLAAAA